MTNTKVDDVLLVAYVDGEIAPAAARQIETMMAADEQLAERVAMFRRSSGILKLAYPESEHEDVPARLVQTIRKFERKERVRNWRAVLLPLAASVAGIAIGVGSYLGMSYASRDGHGSELANLLSEVGEYHAVFSAESEHLVEVPASRKDHLEAWLSQRVHMPLKAPDLSALKLAFAGGRMLVVNGQPVAQLIYIGEAGQRIALCVGQLKAPAAPSEEVKKADDLVLIGKVAGNHMYVVAGPVGDPTIDVLAKHVPQLLSRS